jgi:hypothetical protein
MLNSTLFKRATMTAAVVSMVGLSNVVTAKSSQAAVINLPLPLDNFTYNSSGETTSTGTFNSVFDGNYGLLKQGGVGTSGASPFVSSATINRLNKINVSFDYAFNQNNSNDTFELFLQKGSQETLLTQLSASTSSTFNLDFTNSFKTFFQTQGGGTFNLVYKLSGGVTGSVAGFDNVKLAVNIPEPSTTVAGFLLLTLAAAGGIKRQRKITVALVPNSNLKSN